MKVEANPCCFIVGCPRSGSYLLSSAIQHAYPIAIPVETQFIPLFFRFLPLFGNLQVRKNRETLLRAIYDFLKIWTRLGARGRNFHKEKHISLLITETRFEAIIDSSSDYPGLVSAIFREYARQQDCLYWGDKLTFRLPAKIDNLQNCWPGLKIVHIIRDGRDVALSWRKIWVGPKSVSEAARLWKKHIVVNRAWAAENPDNYLEVEYEKLINDKDREIDRVRQFLGGDYEQADKKKLAFSQILADGDTHAKLSGDVKQNNTGKWKRAMSKQDVLMFELVAGMELQQLGYELSNSDINDVRKSFLRTRILFNGVGEWLSPVNLQFRVKYILPLVLIFYRKLVKT